MNIYKVTQKTKRTQSTQIISSAFTYYQICCKVCLEYLVPEFATYDEVNKMHFYFEKVYFFTIK